MGERERQGVAVPLQPAMKQQLCYQEKLIKWNPYSLKNLALCYEFRTGGEARSIQLVPDACLDFLFCFGEGGPSAVVTGAQTSPISLELEPDTVYFGFKPYSAKGMRRLAAPWTELRGGQADLAELTDCGRILEELDSAASFSERVRAIHDFTRRHLADDSYAPDFVEYAELKLCDTRGNLRIEDLADYTGYTGRYCREKFKEAHGISIKRYSNIIRVQNAIRMLSREDAPEMADVVFENGYFDQSHLNREFRLYTGDTPLNYQRRVLRASGT